MQAKLILEDGTVFKGTSFGYEQSAAGEVVFSTGMVGYPESMTDPSFEGQILVCTYPLIGNYGIPDSMYWESDRIHISGLVVSDYISTPSHTLSTTSLDAWLKREKIPGVEIKDTRALALKLRERGVMLGKVVIGDLPLATGLKQNESQKKKIKSLTTNPQTLDPNGFYDPNQENLVAKVSIDSPIEIGDGKKTIIVYDCGVKHNTPRCFLRRGMKVIIVPWDFDLFNSSLKYDGLFISNGPGDPKMADKTIKIIREALNRKIPTLGICLGNQLLALAAGGDTFKMKFGHRSQNQPCYLVGTDRCYLTTQNHGFAVGKIPKGFKPWFVNANDDTNEGIIHEKLPFMSVQFHPEAMPGPVDTDWIFDYYLEKV